jgi:hypothetical protein
MVICMFMHRDPHTLGAAAFEEGNLTSGWPVSGALRTLSSAPAQADGRFTA